MDVVAFYHDDTSLGYDHQSSPSSVGSASSTDIGAVSAIHLPNNGGYRCKEDMLKSMSLNLSPHMNKNLGHHNEQSVISDNTSAPNTIHGHQGFPHQGVITSAYSALHQGNVLTSPDVNMLKLSSPDLERMIIHNPNNNGQYNMYQKPVQPVVTKEQELYADGFVRELEKLNSASSNPDISSPAMSGSMGSEASQCSVITSSQQSMGMSNEQHYSIPDGYYAQQHPSITTSAGMHMVDPGFIGGTIHHTGMPQNRDILRLKEEPPQTVPESASTPPHSPIDMNQQERIKSERKRQRNRVAASKCRKRKLERISRLEDKVKQLKSHNMDLTTNANVLRQQVAELKSKVMAHVNSGCKLMMSQQHQANF